MGKKIEIDKDVLSSLLREIMPADKKKKRANGTGSVVFLGNGRYKPYASRLTIGKDAIGRAIYHDIDTFKTELEAIVCLENYHKHPTPLRIQEDKYNRIVLLPKKPYPLVSVVSKKEMLPKEDKRNYTFKQVFEGLENDLFPTKEESKIEKRYHIKAEGKLGHKNSSNMRTAYNKSTELYDAIYRDLRLSDFKSCVNNPELSQSTKIEMVKLFKHMDNWAYSEDIIDKKYTSNLKSPSTNYNSREPFTNEEIMYLWNINEKDFRLKFVRDFLLIAIYTGCRAEELLFIYTKNVFLEQRYFVTGLKTEAGINRTIPIHLKISPIFEYYFNTNNEFLFTSVRRNKLSYGMYLRYYKRFIDKYPQIKGKTAHCGRHTLETELQKLNIKQTITNSILGHKNGNVADDVYNHVSLEEKIKTIDLVTFKDSKICILKTEKKVS